MDLMTCEIRNINAEDAENLISFIRDTVEKSGCAGAIVGLSGGLDSAVVTKLCVDALGGDKVYNVFLPTRVTVNDDYKLTMDLSKAWGTEYKVVDVQPAVDAFTGALFSKVEAPLEKGNISARCRMVALYNIAKKKNYLVFGTTNKSEYLMGYFTKYGDGACDVSPMNHLYKTQVWQLAELIDVPKEVIDKIPTAGLWEGQTDEEEMGISYKNLDMALNMLENGSDDATIANELSLDITKVSDIRKQVAAMAHKRSPAITYKP